MLTTLMITLAYLSATFLLGLLLGWLLWNFGGATQISMAATETQLWKDRSTQSSIALHLEKEKLTALEKERDSLKKRLKTVRRAEKS